ncbi:hypothetical protein G9A89_008770 [Geosiphon pyriformis]|nr:hypothetical protein G9A89_008770 [Geosiphon pyriformis]
MDIETTASSIISKKKTPKSTFHGSTDGFFSQKKKVVLNNVKHSGNERDIFLSKFGSSNSIYSDVESLSDEDEDVNMSGANGGFFLGSVATTPKTKRVNTGAGFGSLLNSPNFHMNNNKVVLFLRLPISFEKKWIDSKIIKTSVEVSVKRLFTLDINLLAVEEKLVMVKTQLIRKIFSTVNEKSMEMAALLAREKGIDINSDLKRQEVHSDQTVVIKEISMDTPKEIIIAALAKFGKIKSIKIQLIGLWQKAVMEFAEPSQTEHLAAK